MRPAGHLAPRGPDHRPPGRDEALVAHAIVFESLARVVPLAAVGLNHDPLLTPNEVGLDRRAAVIQDDELVALGIWDPEGPGDRQQGLLVLVRCGGLADVVLGQDPADGLGAGAGGVAGDLVVDGVQVEALDDFALVEGALELARV